MAHTSSHVGTLKAPLLERDLDSFVGLSAIMQFQGIFMFIHGVIQMLICIYNIVPVVICFLAKGSTNMFSINTPVKLHRGSLITWDLVDIGKHPLTVFWQ